MTTLGALGRGWTFPVAVDRSEGGLTYLEGPAKVHQSIRLILDTEPGERIMRPAFGCGLRRYLMKPNTVAVRALIKHDVELALTTWEPRIELTGVDVRAGDDPSLVEIEIAYVHVRTGAPDNVTYLLPLQ
jgi:phage baseplate assembly protein W